MRKQPPRSKRAGVAIVLVIGMLAMTLGVAYAMIRLQTMSISIEANYRRRGDARLAAMTGMSAALRAMHQDSWTGVGTSISGNLGDGLSYTARFTAGDASLKPGDPNYGDYPYRVTIRSTGSAEHPLQAGMTSTHAIETIVQLVPRAIQAAPASWSRVHGQTVLQWGSDDFTFELPAQIEGNVHAQGPLIFADKAPVETTRAFHGHIDEVAVFAKALSATDILNIHNGALGIGASPVTQIQGHGPVAYWRFNESAGASVAADDTGTYHGHYAGAKPGQAARPFGAAGTSARFDGVNDNVYGGNFSITGTKLTILCWFRADSFSTSGVRLVSKALSPSDSDHYWTLGTRYSGGLNRLIFYVRAGSSNSVEASTVELLPGTWTFAAGVYDGTRIRIYKDGLQVASKDVSDSLTTSGNALILIGDAPPGSPRGRLMFDYTGMQKAALGDQRPVAGHWASPTGKVTAEAQSLITDELGSTTANVPLDNSAPVSFPISVTTYQLYKGGPVYTVPTLPSNTLQSSSFLSDPISNPLGIFKYKGNVTIRDGVTIRGSLALVDATGDRITFDFGSITWDPVDLPVIDGETTSRQLPIALVPKEIFIKKEVTNLQLRGMMVNNDHFEFEKGGTGMTVQLLGQLAAKKITLKERDPWPTTNDAWLQYLRDFLLQRNGGVQYFPQWLSSAQSLVTSPRLAIKPDGAGRLYHWPNFAQPIFEKRSGDPGLRWRIVAWKDGA